MLGGEGLSNVLRRYGRVKHVHGFCIGSMGMGWKRSLSTVVNVSLLQQHCWRLRRHWLNTPVCRTASRSLRYMYLGVSQSHLVVRYPWFTYLLFKEHNPHVSLHFGSDTIISLHIPGYVLHVWY